MRVAEAAAGPQRQRRRLVARPDGPRTSRGGRRRLPPSRTRRPARGARRDGCRAAHAVLGQHGHAEGRPADTRRTGGVRREQPADPRRGARRRHPELAPRRPQRFLPDLPRPPGVRGLHQRPCADRARPGRPPAVVRPAGGAPGRPLVGARVRLRDGRGRDRHSAAGTLGSVPAAHPALRRGAHSSGGDAPLPRRARTLRSPGRTHRARLGDGRDRHRHHLRQARHPGNRAPCARVESRRRPGPGGGGRPRRGLRHLRRCRLAGPPRHAARGGRAGGTGAGGQDRPAPGAVRPRHAGLLRRPGGHRGGLPGRPRLAGHR